jgi:hypothetical protein
MKNTLKALVASFLAVGVANVNASDAEFKAIDLDIMIEHYSPTREGTVELTLFRKVAVQGSFLALPKKAKTQYLQAVMKDFNVKLEVNHKISVLTPKGEKLRFYMPDELAQEIKKKSRRLPLTSLITIYGYHVYNSKHGPGILISSYE